MNCTLFQEDIKMLINRWWTLKVTDPPCDPFEMAAAESDLWMLGNRPDSPLLQEHLIKLRIDQLRLSGMIRV